MGELKLFGTSISFFCIRVEWALKFKGIDYEYIEEDLTNKSPLLLKYNPVHKKIPVLLHNGKPIAESLVILEYIEETWKVNPLLPEDPYEKAKARFWAKFIDEKCFSSVRSIFISQGEEQEKAVESALETLKILDEEIKGKKFFGGESIGYLDLVASWISHWLPVFGECSGVNLLSAERFPSLYAWSENFIKVDAIKEKLPPREQLVATFSARRKSQLAAAENK
ncbi:putative glutathione S-transferase [Tasmannia lanceolata]|uniref:putative glutathione S-transferase n=1 Tax=Tasmannia lanceolata TaxID=3420 RepID=UPI00406421A9